MNKQQAYEIAKQAELTICLNAINRAAEAGDYSRKIHIKSEEVICELNKLGFNCGLQDKKNNLWYIDWSK